MLCAQMLVCLVLLALAPTIHWNMWLITLVCALVNAVYNAIAMLALDPVSGRWLGWAAMIDRMQTEAQQGKADTQVSSTHACIHAHTRTRLSRGLKVASCLQRHGKARQTHR